MAPDSYVDRARFGLHRERGPESYKLTFKLTSGHDLVHTRQARKTLEPGARQALSGGLIRTSRPEPVPRRSIGIRR